MKREVKQATGKANYDAKTGTLTITTNAKRGKKVVPLVVVYTVEDLHPDARVADPAFRLTKEDGETYDVAVDEWGPVCSCPHAVFRGHANRIPCKHALALMAVGLMPKPQTYPGAKK